jgi:DNA-binding response OmpR family regulator
VVDDEPDTALMQSVLRALHADGFEPIVVRPGGDALDSAPGAEDIVASGDDFEAEALYAIAEYRPAGVILDVRFGEHRDDLFKGLGILGKIVERDPELPVLMFTQYSRGPARDAAVAGTLRHDARVDFVDKLASPEEVVLRLRRMIGAAPERIQIGDEFIVDPGREVVYATSEQVADGSPIKEIQGMKFGILLELATAYYRSPGELVPFSRLERFSEGDDSRASLRVRIREIKNAMGDAIGRRLGPDDLIINIRNRGYRLTPLRPE